MQTTTEGAPIQLVALGQGVWLDEIRRGNAEPIKDVPGGSVTFTTLGARLFAADKPKTIGMSFNAGHDFPERIIDVLRDWSIDLTVHRHSDKPSSRGLVFYDEQNNNRKGFQRLTEPSPVTVKDLKGTRLLYSKAFVFFGTAEYVEEQVADLTSLRGDAPRPLIIWEPHAKSCCPDTLAEHLYAARLVDVFSPNHEELQSFFSEPSDTVDRECSVEQAMTFVNAGIGTGEKGLIVVRASSDGCAVLGGRGFWVPSFHRPGSQSVVDPTGAGNAFLGAFAAAFLNDRGDELEAAVRGTVAASFALEQVGLPVRNGDGETETWNGHKVLDRLADFRDRLTG